MRNSPRSQTYTDVCGRDKSHQFSNNKPNQAIIVDIVVYRNPNRYLGVLVVKNRGSLNFAPIAPRAGNLKIMKKNYNVN